MSATLLLVGALAAGPVSAAPADIGWYAIPNVGFDTDDGLGFGGRLEVAWKDGQHEPYRQALVLQGYTTVTGYHHHRVRFDRLGMGAAGRLRLTVHLAYRQWKNDGYWGIGNGTVREQTYQGPFGFDDPDRRRYRYSLVQPFAQVVARQALSDDGPWSVYGALNPKWSRVSPYAISVLGEHRPYGMGGGLGLQVLGGVVHDTRLPEVAPHGGMLVELGARFTPDLGGEAGGFGGPMVSVRHFAGLGGRVVLASRATAEWLLGSVPFYEMVHWGGLVPMQGFGGFETLRGVRFGRWRAPGKGIANTELRVRVLTHPVGETTLGWELAPFAEVGSVWGAGDTATAPAPDQPFHPAVGGGLRLVYDEIFVGRLDVGVGWDPVATPSGAPRVARTTGIYLVFDYPY
jgi:hypothetical protein